MNNDLKVDVDKLTFEGHEICNEFYYHFLENQDFLENQKIVNVWAQGLKKVYDFKDQSGYYTLEKAIDYMDDDQEKMLAIINAIIAAKHPASYVDYIYVNYLTNVDGSENLIKQILIVYQINNSDLIIRVPYYAFSDYAKGEFYQKIMNEGDK